MKIGIDLGTTTSTVSVLEPNGKVRAEKPLDSLGAWRNGAIVFGEAAHRALSHATEKSFPVRDLKLSLGNRDIKVGPNTVPTSDLVTEMLKFLARQVAGDAPIREAIIGTPVNVSGKHREALLQSALNAGFENVRLIYEPTAALVGAINPGRMSNDNTILVIDWGGGTLDLSIVRKSGDVLHELAVDGDVSVLGGSQMDERILDLLIDNSPGVKAKLAAIPEGRDLLKIEIEIYKRQILTADFPEDEDDVPIWPSWLDLDSAMTLSPSLIVDVVTDMANEAVKRIHEFLYRSRISLPHLTHVLFAGGVSQCHIIRNLLINSFPDVEVIETAIPQQLTGYGCGRLLQYGFQVQLASDFGVRQSDNSFCRILPSGHDLGLGTYRSCDFFVTDPIAMEAAFDFGILPSKGSVTSMISDNSDGFVSLGNMFLRCQNSAGDLRGLSDLIKLYCGITHSLAVTVYAESNVAGDSKVQSFTGLPLMIRLGGLEP
jgi:molecular chaperone DnaK